VFRHAFLTFYRRGMTSRIFASLSSISSPLTSATTLCIHPSEPSGGLCRSLVRNFQLLFPLPRLFQRLIDAEAGRLLPGRKFLEGLAIRSDPFERADEDGTVFYGKWAADRLFLLVPALTCGSAGRTSP
jgi:hypothetical protein